MNEPDGRDTNNAQECAQRESKSKDTKRQEEGARLTKLLVTVEAANILMPRFVTSEPLDKTAWHMETLRRAQIPVHIDVLLQHMCRFAQDLSVASVVAADADTVKQLM